MTFTRGTGSHWRDKARAVIRDVLEKSSGKSPEELKTALHDAYPFGERAMHPYKIWLDEIKRQTGAKVRPVPCVCTHAKGAHHSRAGACAAADCTCPKYGVTDPRQRSLLDP